MIFPKPRLIPYAVLAFLTATGWLCFDWLRAHRNTHWVPPSLQEWLGVVLAILCLSGTLVLLAVLLRTLSMLCSKRHARLIMALLWVGATVTIGIVWGCLSPEISSRASSVFVLVPAFAAGLLSMGIYSPRSATSSVASLGSLWGSALIAGMGMADLSTRITFLSTQRGTILVAVFFLTTTILIVTGWLLWRTGRFPLLALQSTLAILLLGAGPAFDALQRNNGGHFQQPDVVLVTVDTLRADLCSVYGGSVPMPSLERIAANGTVFDRNYSLAPWTSPSMYGLLTSQYPLGPSGDAVADMAEARRWYVPSATTIADQFRSAGYETVGLVANPLLTRKGGPTSGCEHLFKPDYEERNSPRSILHQLPLAEGLLAGFLPLEWIDTTQLLTEYALRWLHSERARPLFLWVHYMDPHDPYDPPTRYRALKGAWPFFAPAHRQYSAPPENVDLDTLPDGEQAYIRSLYQGEMRYADEAIGRLLNAITSPARLERTIFCVTADHGEELWDHGRWGHGHSLFNELVHVPWLITGKGVAHQRISNPVSAIDCTPTLAALAGVSHAADWKGISLVPQVAGGTEASPSPVFINVTGPKTKFGVEAIVQGELKLIRRYGEPPLALYNLATDPTEQANILPGAEQTAAPLFQQLEAWSQKLHEGEPTPATAPDAQRVQEEMQERLRSMGYLR